MQALPGWTGGTLVAAWAPGAPAPAHGSGGPGLVGYLVAGLLALGGLYLIIRLLELDRMNKETPDQEDPLLGDPPEDCDEK